MFGVFVLKQILLYKLGPQVKALDLCPSHLQRHIILDWVRYWVEWLGSQAYIWNPHLGSPVLVFRPCSLLLLFF